MSLSALSMLGISLVLFIVNVIQFLDRMYFASKLRQAEANSLANLDEAEKYYRQAMALEPDAKLGAAVRKAMAETEA